MRLITSLAFISTTLRTHLPRTISMAASRDISSLIPTITLNDGNPQPALGFGTYKVGFIPPGCSASLAGEAAPGKLDAVTENCITQALKTGYRFFDCAEFYGNQVEIGTALKKSGVPRKDLYLESKVWTSSIDKGPSGVRASVLQTIQDLQCEYMDLMLVHWPVPLGKHIDAYVELQELQKEGLIKSIGISNYAIEDYEDLLRDSRVNVVPVVNQIEVNPFLYRKKTIEYFKNKNIVIQSYRALQNGKGVDSVAISEVAAKHQKSTAQVLLRWCYQAGCVVIAKTLNGARMVENMDIFGFELDDADMDSLGDLTTEESIRTFIELYQTCTTRGTSVEGIKHREITSN